MIENLFGSKTRYKLLILFTTNPNQAFYVREITRKIEEQINSVRRELSNLLSMGVIISKSTNNKLYYEVNQEFDYYAELFKLFNKHKQDSDQIQAPASKKDASKKEAGKSAKASTEMPDPQFETTEDQAASDASDREKYLGNVSLVVLSGVFTLDNKAPADVMIVGNVTPSGVKKYIDNLESSIDAEISYMLFNEEDFNYRRKIRDRATMQMLSSKLVVKIDKNNLINV